MAAREQGAASAGRHPGRPAMAAGGGLGAGGEGVQGLRPAWFPQAWFTPARLPLAWLSLIPFDQPLHQARPGSRRLASPRPGSGRWARPYLDPARQASLDRLLAAPAGGGGGGGGGGVRVRYADYDWSLNSAG